MEDIIWDKVLDKLTDIECKKRLIKEAHEDFEEILAEIKMLRDENEKLKKENEMLNDLISSMLIFFKRPISEANTFMNFLPEVPMIMPENELYTVRMETNQPYGFKMFLTGILLEKLLEIYDEKHQK